MARGNGVKGRPKAWDTIIKPQLDKIVEWRNEGHTEAQIAKLLGIGYTTLNENKNKHSELAQVLKKSKLDLVGKLEKSLFQIALGGFTTTKTTRKYVEINGVIQNDIVKVEQTIIEHKPDMAALAFSLKNLAGDKWQDKISHNIDNEDMSNAVKEFLRAGKKK